jgi:hypothetical protein
VFASASKSARTTQGIEPALGVVVPAEPEAGWRSSLAKLTALVEAA